MENTKNEFLNFPNSYYKNSQEEEEILHLANNFQRQFQFLHPQRPSPPLYLGNEFKVSKVICTSLCPVKVNKPSELRDWQECASFIADFIEYDILEFPTKCPEELFSLDTALKRRRGNSLDMSMILTTLLLSSDIDAYTVQGYATRDVTGKIERDKTDPPLPLKFSHFGEANVNLQSGNATKKNKYYLDFSKAKEFWMEGKKFEETEKPKIEYQFKTKKDVLFGNRVHFWVLIQLVENGETQSFFLESTTGEKIPLDDPNYLGIEFVWNSRNFWCNNQKFFNSCKEIRFDFHDCSKWQAFLPDYSLFDAPQNGNVQNRMPETWLTGIQITPKDVENKYPLNGKHVQYKTAEVFTYNPQTMENGLVYRVVYYQTDELKIPVKSHCFFNGRADNLAYRFIDFTKEIVKEYFSIGRKDALKEHTYHNDDDRRFLQTMTFYSYLREDRLAERSWNQSKTTDSYVDRSDFLFKSEVTYEINSTFDVEQMPSQQNKNSGAEQTIIQNVDTPTNSNEQVQHQKEENSSDENKSKMNIVKTDFTIRPSSFDNCEPILEDIDFSNWSFQHFFESIDPAERYATSESDSENELLKTADNDRSSNTKDAKVSKENLINERNIKDEKVSEGKVTGKQNANDEIVSEESATDNQKITNERVSEENTTNNQNIKEEKVLEANATRMIEDEKVSEKNAVNTENIKKEKVSEDNLTDKQESKNETVSEKNLTSIQKINDEKVLEENAMDKKNIKDENVSEGNATVSQEINHEKVFEENVTEKEEIKNENILEVNDTDKQEIKNEKVLEENAVDTQEVKNELPSEKKSTGEYSIKNEKVSDESATDKQKINDEKVLEENVTDKENIKDENISKGNVALENKVKVEKVSEENATNTQKINENNKASEGNPKDQQKSKEETVSEYTTTSKQKIHDEKVLEENSSDIEKIEDENISDKIATDKQKIKDEKVSEETAIGKPKIEAKFVPEEIATSEQNIKNERVLEENVTDKENVKDENVSERNATVKQNIKDEKVSKENLTDKRKIRDEKISEEEESYKQEIKNKENVSEVDKSEDPIISNEIQETQDLSTEYTTAAEAEGEFDKELEIYEELNFDALSDEELETDYQIYLSKLWRDYTSSRDSKLFYMEKTFQDLKDMGNKEILHLKKKLIRKRRLNTRYLQRKDTGKPAVRVYKRKSEEKGVENQYTNALMSHLNLKEKVAIENMHDVNEFYIIKDLEEKHIVDASEEIIKNESMELLDKRLKENPSSGKLFGDKRILSIKHNYLKDPSCPVVNSISCVWFLFESGTYRIDFHHPEEMCTSRTVIFTKPECESTEFAFSDYLCRQIIPTYETNKISRPRLYVYLVGLLKKEAIVLRENRIIECDMKQLLAKRKVEMQKLDTASKTRE